MSDAKLVVSTDSWHARRFRASAGVAQKTNLCRYFWVVVKSLASSLSATLRFKIILKYTIKALITIMVLYVGAILLGGLLLLLSLLIAPLLSLVYPVIGVTSSPGNTIPWIQKVHEWGTAPQVDHYTQSNVDNFVFAGFVADAGILLLVVVWLFVRYNKGHHQAGFIRLSWERFKVWKDGTVVCPIIEFEESK